MTLLITGGAGFIGSNLVASLNDSGVDDIIIVDTMQNRDQWKNLAKRKFFKLVAPLDKFTPNITAVVHLAAVTDTTVTDQDQMLAFNYETAIDLLEICQAENIPFIYASSAAMYGDGSKGFSEATSDLQPLNLYGWSKLLFDRHVQNFLAGRPLSGRSQVAGLRFFNVYGPNEYHKGKMASVLCQQHGFAQSTLFSGAPMRDFVHVEDAVAVIRWFLDHPDVSGIFNVGTGEQTSFEMLMVNGYPDRTIVHRQMPDSFVESYQFNTQADLTRLRAAGCDVSFRPVEVGVPHYVDNYLSQKDRYR